MLNKMWDKITYPFANLNGYTVEVWEWISNLNPQFIMNVIMMGFKWIHASKRAHTLHAAFGKDER